MAINCKVCNKELDVFSGGRCRKCRQLVCKNCTAAGGATNTQGLLCKNCAQTEAALAVAHGLTPPPRGETSRGVMGKIPAWAWLVTPLFVGVIFVWLVALPYLGAEWHLYILRHSENNDKVAVSMQYLGNVGSNFIVRELQKSVQTGVIADRAVRTLGKIPTREVRHYLQQLQQSPDTPPELRSLIIEALREQERKNEFTE